MFIGCREICKSEQHNAVMMKILNDIKLHKNNNHTVAQTTDMLNDTTLEKIIDKIHLIGTTYYTPMSSKDVKYHSIARQMVDAFSVIFARSNIPLTARILSVQEKSLGYDRTKTMKITNSDDSDTTALCYVTAETAVCSVPKKNSRISGRGTMITGITISEPGVSLGELLDKIEMKDQTIADLINKTAFIQISTYINQISNTNDICLMQNIAEYLSEYTEKYAKEMQKLTL